MSQDLLKNETHVSDFKGTIKTRTSAPADGSEIDNLKAGDIYYNNFSQDIYIYDGSYWYSARATAS